MVGKLSLVKRKTWIGSSQLPYDGDLVEVIGSMSWRLLLTLLTSQFLI